MKQLLFLSALFIVCFRATAQLPELVKIIDAAADPEGFTACNGKTYFTAYSYAEGKSLWVTDGTATGTYVLKAPSGDGPEDPIILGVFNNKLYFSATGEGKHREVWFTDGTTPGTQLLKDINPTGGSEPRNFTVAGSYAFFTAYDGTHGNEIWVTDGTTTGTYMSADMEPQQGQHDGTFRKIVAYNNSIIFSRTNETTNHTDVWILHADGNPPTNLTEQFPASYGVWDNADYMIVYNGKVYFPFLTGNEGRELFATDGTIGGTQFINVMPGPAGFNPEFFFIEMGKLFMTGNDPNGSGMPHLFVSDGTASGTLHLGPNTVLPSYASDGNFLYYYAYDDAFGGELWKTDGTPGGTVRVADINPGPLSSKIQNITVANGKIYFSATDGVNERQPWISDGTAAGTHMIKVIYNGSEGSSVGSYTELDGKVYFTARKANNDFHLFETDGTEAGTFSIQPIDATNNNNPLGKPGTVISPPTRIKVTNDMILFRANYGLGRQLYRIGNAPASIVQLSSTQGLQVFPNPAGNFVTVTGGNNSLKGMTLVLTDISGKTVASIPATDAKVIIPTAHLAPGIYLLSAGTRTIRITKE